MRWRVDECLTRFVDDRARVLTDVSPDLAPVVRAVRDLVGGGKRLRASFCYWGWRGAGGAPMADAAVRAAASLELFHLAALVHDDLMDHSDTRRGRPTVHRVLTDQHARHGLRGDGEEFGAGAAILLGDLLLTWSDELLSECGAPDDALAAARAVYALMRGQVIAGQYLDMLEQAREHTGAEASRRVLRYKSAKYTVEHPLLLGAALAGADADVRAAYSAYGLPVGEAFQLRDDVLGVFGDAAITGKPAGDDLREGKKTMLVVTALDRADPAAAALLARGLGDRHLDDAGLDDLRDVLARSGALAHVEDEIDRLVSAGLAALDTAGLPGDVTDVLDGLATGAARREA
jgi:geranylgeranyl diphosphate synthase type I